jgi:hypothetical protein
MTPGRDYIDLEELLDNLDFFARDMADNMAEPPVEFRRVGAGWSVRLADSCRTELAYLSEADGWSAGQIEVIGRILDGLGHKAFDEAFDNAREWILAADRYQIKAKEAKAAK